MPDNEVYIQFIIEGFSQKPSYITDYLKVEPNKTWIKGDLKIKKGTIKHKNNGWALVIENKNVLHVDSIIKDLIKKLSNKKSELSSLDDVNKKFLIVVYSRKIMPSFVYDENIISFLFECGISLEQDIYCINESS